MVEALLTLVISLSSTPLMLYWSVRCWQLQVRRAPDLHRILDADARRFSPLLRLHL